MTRKKPRKPRGLRRYNYETSMSVASIRLIAHGYRINPRDCRRLSKWLERAAKYLEAKR